MPNKKIVKTVNRSEEIITPGYPQFVPLMDPETQKGYAAAKIAGQSQSSEVAAIFNWVSEYVIFQDVENRILWANDNVLHVTGLTLGKLKERRCYEIWHRRRQACQHCPFEEVFKTGRTVGREIVTASGRICHARGGAIRDDHGHIIAMVKVVSDITERIKDEELLRQSEERYRARIPSIPSIWSTYMTLRAISSTQTR